MSALVEAIGDLLSALGAGLGLTVDHTANSLLGIAGAPLLDATQNATLSGMGAAGYTSLVSGLQGVILPLFSSTAGLPNILAQLGAWLADTGTILHSILGVF